MSAERWLHRERGGNSPPGPQQRAGVERALSRPSQDPAAAAIQETTSTGSAMESLAASLRPLRDALHGAVDAADAAAEGAFASLLVLGLVLKWSTQKPATCAVEARGSRPPGHGRGDARTVSFFSFF